VLKGIFKVDRGASFKPRRSRRNMEFSSNPLLEMKRTPPTLGLSHLTQDIQTQSPHSPLWLRVMFRPTTRQTSQLCRSTSVLCEWELMLFLQVRRAVALYTHQGVAIVQYLQKPQFNVYHGHVKRSPGRSVKAVRGRPNSRGRGVYIIVTSQQHWVRIKQSFETEQRSIHVSIGFQGGARFQNNPSHT
jgi:hypothetical protein